MVTAGGPAARGAKIMQKPIIAMVLTATLALGACSAVMRNHGFVPSEEELENIIVGVDTRAAVEEQFGPPTMAGVRGESAIYYVASTWRHFGPAKPTPVRREIIAVLFDANETVTDIARFALEDGKAVVLSRRVSEGGAEEISVIQQILGSIGRVDGGQLFGAS